MKPMPDTMKAAIEYFTLYKHLSPPTVAWYTRVISVYCAWAGKPDVPLALFDGTEISRMLLAKERAGRSPYYLKSLRGGLVAFLRLVRDGEPVEKVRCIKTPKLDPKALSPAEIETLLRACHCLPHDTRWLYVLIFSLGYYTGLEMNDIVKLERADIRDGGTLFYRRGKTGQPIFVRIPPDVLAIINQRCPTRGPMIRLPYSREYFRRVVRSIFDRAGLCGTFKTLRKSAGSLVEAEKPGTGHRHLGNTRAIFERHYEALSITRSEPTMPPLVALPAGK